MVRKTLALISGLVVMLGVVSAISQVILVRELTVNGYGNEFLMGAALAAWLSWVAVGSTVGGRFARRPKNSFLTLVGLQTIAGLALFLEILLIRWLKGLGGFAGETPNVLASLVAALLIPAPLCLIFGAWWTTATRIFCWHEKDVAPQAVNRAYRLELAGFVVGGVAASFVFLLVPELTVALWLIFLQAAIGVGVVFSTRRHGLAQLVAVLALAAIFPAASAATDVLNAASLSWRFRQQAFVTSINSSRANIAVTRQGGQHQVYVSGLSLGSAEDFQSAEDAVHWPMLLYPAPRNVLLVGGGWHGAVAEILKHPVERVWYAEFDPALPTVVSRYLTPELQASWSDRRVTSISIDVRNLPRYQLPLFDVVIVDLPDPATALLHRYYTREFFQTMASRLTSGGIFSIQLTAARVDTDRALVDLNASVLQSLRQAFANVAVMANDENLIVATNGPALNADSATIAKRFAERKLQNIFVTSRYLSYQLVSDHRQLALNQMEDILGVPLNTDVRPVATYYHAQWRIAQLFPRLMQSLSALVEQFLQVGMGALVLGMAVLVFWALRERSERRARQRDAAVLAVVSIAAAGFTTLALEVLVFYAYQIAVGTLYDHVALLIAAFMVGMAAGAFTIHRVQQKKILAHLSVLHGLLIVVCGLSTFAFTAALRAETAWGAAAVLVAAAVAAGFFGAFIFPIANHQYLSNQLEPTEKTGVPYAADVVGSCAGALLVSLILLPRFGIAGALLFTMLVNLAVVMVAGCFMLIPQKISR